MTSEGSAPKRAATHGRWRLLLPALAGWVTAAALVHLPGTARIVAVILGIFGIAAGVFAALSRRRGASLNPGRRTARSRWGHSVGGVVLITAAVVIVICARIDLAERARESPAIQAAAESGISVELTAQLTSYPGITEGFGGELRSWSRAKLLTVDGITLAESVPAMLWLPIPAPDDWAPGGAVDLTGSLVRATPESPAAYEVRVRNITNATELLEPSPFARFSRVSAGLRHILREAAAEVPGAALVPGFAVGDTTLVDTELNDLLLGASLSHLTAVSGSNTGLVVFVCVAIAARFGVGRRMRLVVAASGLLFFVLVVGPDSSVQRAAIMAVVLLASGFGGKRAYALPALGLAVLVLLVANPWQAVQAGFALSVAATAGILLFAPQLTGWLKSGLRLPDLLALPLAVACVAQVTVAPLLLLLQPGLPAGGVIANILAAPAAPLGTGLGLLALVVLPVFQPIGVAAVWCASFAARWVEASGAFAVALPGSRWFWPGGWAGALVLAAVEILLLVAFVLASGKVATRDGRTIGARRPWATNTESPPRLQLVVRVSSAVAAGVIVAIVVVVPAGVKLGVPGDWMVVACDVGQGDAVLVRDPQHPAEVMLVDTGDDPAKLEACLDLFGVREIALLVLTHDDRDHVGALHIAAARSRAALIAPPIREHATYRPLTEQLDGAEVLWRIATEGDRGGAVDSSQRGLVWEILAPKADVTPRTANGASLVLAVEVQGFVIVLLGDTGESEQSVLMRGYPDLAADIVKVAHHGSRDQLRGVYGALSARYALISVGENRYGHPHPDLLSSLFAAESYVLRTDELGSVAVRIHEGELEPWAAGERSSVTP